MGVMKLQVVIDDGGCRGEWDDDDGCRVPFVGNDYEDRRIGGPGGGDDRGNDYPGTVKMSVVALRMVVVTVRGGPGGGGYGGGGSDDDASDGFCAGR